MTEPAKKTSTRPNRPKPVEPANDEHAPQAPAHPPAPTTRDLRRKRARRLGLRLALGVLLPTTVAAGYYGGVATPRYESVASFTIQSADGKSPAGIETLLTSVASSASRDVRMVQQYIRSRDMLRYLSDEHDFAAHYSADELDPVSRLSPDASFEERYDYFLERVDAEYDSEADVVTVRVRAYDAETAEELTRAILDASERKVNRMMEQARQDRIELAQREVEQAEKRLTEARKKVRQLQAERREINPQASAEAMLSVKSSLQQELAKARAELGAMRENLQPGTPQLEAQKQRVAALRRQVDAQQKRLAGEDEQGLHADIAAFEPALAEKEFAQKAYESALKSLELARLEADRQHRYLVTVSRPSAPQEPTHPRVFLAVLTVFVLSFALVGILSLIVASIREHADL